MTKEEPLEGSVQHRQTWEKRFREYERTYLQTLRDIVHQYAVISDAFPQEFHSPTRSLLVYCRDGFLLARYLDTQESFHFETSQEESIYDAAHRLRAGDIKFKAPNAKRWFFEMRNFRVEIRPDESDKVIVFQPDWYSLTIGNFYSPKVWSRADARFRATAEGLTFVAAHLLGIDRAELSGLEAKPAQRTYEAYEVIIDAFRVLIESSTTEAPLQDFLRDHPALLTLEIARVIPKFQLGNDYVTDFVLELAEHQYILVEIEAATRPLFTAGGNPSSELTHAIQQVEDWLTWIASAGEYIRSKLPGLVEPECWVVIGRSLKDDNLRSKWERKKRSLSRIRLLTYDDLLERAQRQLRTLRSFEGN